MNEEPIMNNLHKARGVPKDRIYAFVGLSTLRNKIQINYEPTYSINALLADVARAIVLYEDVGLDILSQAGTAAHSRALPQGSDHLPTWIPDWNEQEVFDRDKFTNGLELPPNSAAGKHLEKSRTASAFSVNVIIPRSAFKITQGITRSYPHLGDSGKLYHSHFCDNCGASTHGIPDASTSVLAIKAGSLDEDFVNLGGMDSEFYVIDRLGYLKALEGVKQYDGM
ncbi:hypothetical protein K4K59_009731 [Colletotrichum sp. SAR11_240]|nr:hypothetical protein K4K59_009731 [Colletotrichum sp. SAR11_240]